MIAICLCAAWLVVNLVTAMLFGIDKRRAVAGGWRISEATLLGWAALGGSGGALWARRHFRHKTRKQPFATILDVIATVHVGLLAGWIVAARP
jgi:uncharacterized membrane protein YsdA (DUF1294 family)